MIITMQIGLKQYEPMLVIWLWAGSMFANGKEVINLTPFGATYFDPGIDSAQDFAHFR